VNEPVGAYIGPRGVTPLMLAGKGGHAEILAMLLKAGAKVDAANADIFGGGGDTALHYAAEAQEHETFLLLLRAGADPNKKDKNGFTPMRRALPGLRVKANAIIGQKQTTVHEEIR
jgi:ankyrin repeat protein